MLYETNCAILFKGSRVERGSQVEMTEDEAASLGEDVKRAVVKSSEQSEDDTHAEKALEEMSFAELKAAAEARGLAKGGSMADLIDRIKLHDESSDGDEDGDDSDEDDTED